jgi:arylsulfatase A-like enzyme
VRAVACLFFFLVFTSCKRSEVVYDFAASLATASLTAETARIDFGTAGSRHLLLDGWSEDELWQPDNTIVWGTGRSSSLVVFHFGLDGLELTYRCIPSWLDPRQQSVTFVVNGNRLEPTVLNRGLEIYRQSIPAPFLRSGANDIRIDYGFATEPRADDDRRITVAWDWMEFSSHPPRPAARRAGNETVLMAPRTQLSFLAPVRSGCSLKLDAVDAGPNGVLQVLISGSDGAAARQKLAADEAIDIPLAPTRASLTAISFVQTQLRRSDSAQWAKLVRPRIECAPASDSPYEAAERPPIAATSPRPSVLIYLVDTLRVDHLGVYGYRRPTSINIDAFARDSVVFTRAIAQSGWTKTSIASILTGLVPFHHGTLDADDALPPSIPTLPTMLGAAGYSRFAAVANGSVGPEFGFARGFEPFVNLAGGSTEEAGAVARVVVESFQAWLDKRPRNKPFFAYVHTIDPHASYSAPQPYAREFSSRLKTALDRPGQAAIATLLKARPELTVEDVRADLMARYDAEIVYNDAMFGRAIADLKRRGLYDSTLIIFTSDHGEEFLDHGYWEHGHSVYPEILHVPLIVKFPHNRNAGTVVDTNVQHVDLVPTILEAARAGGAWKLDGMPLMDVPAAAERPIVSYLRLNEFEIMSAVYGDYQYILRKAPGPLKEQLVRFGGSSSDPDASPSHWRSYWTQGQPWQKELRRTVVRFYQQAQKVQTPQVPLEEDLARRLRALGYLR